MFRSVKIYRWRSDSRHNNFGDEITVPILERVFGIEAVPSDLWRAQMIGAGSILDNWMLRPRPRRRRFLDMVQRRLRPLHVWGSGFILPDSPPAWRRRMRFHAVRGELTASRIGFTGPLGDPGILASLLVKRPEKKAAVGFVPHQIDVARFRNTDLPRGWKMIDPERPVIQVVREIGSCELVVSSSLHGLITADSFCIPCVWAKTDKPLFGSTDFKFHDYATVRRTPFNPPVSYAEAMNGGLAGTSAGRPIDEWQRELIGAFPYRL